MYTETSPQSTTRLVPSQMRSFLQQRLVGAAACSILLNLGLTGASTWNVWNTSQNLKVTVERQAQLQELSSKFIYLDEVLTMSASMLVSTGQPQWEKRYQSNVVVFEQVAAEFFKNIPASDKETYQQFDAASNQLLAMEDQAFKLVKEQKLTAAAAILFGEKYGQQKKIYAGKVQTLIASIKNAVNTQTQSERRALELSIVLALISLGLSAITGLGIIATVRDYIRDQEDARRSIQTFQDNLLQLNEQLQAEAQLRLAQQHQVLQASETLQTDVGHILDIVCALEEGDLTVQAEVSEGATGLVSDTLNRLIESLNGIMAVVVSSAHQVTDRATELDRLAVETASQAQNQTQSIQQVGSLIAQVNKLTINSREQAIATTNAVQLAKIAIGSGQEEMTAMAGGIESLQNGTEQIVKRMQILNDFVELAAQFSKDQKRVAALTRVLALNASLLSTRAVKEQDPEQFASIASEFETVAIQVNELAIDTNRSLVTLQQRTNQIQTVTSGLDQDVVDINQLVQKFTNEVGKSRQAFHNIQTVTDQVATMGVQVNASSQDIVKVVRDTLNAIQSIGIIAQNTENKAAVTREQVQTMGELAQTLLQRMEFFQLNTALPAGVAMVSGPEDSTAVPHFTPLVYQPLAAPRR
jgi:methyl-accepting chemotaxis protein PixJ